MKKPLSCFLMCVASLLGLAACGMQAEIIQGRHWDLNETIRETKDEQLLLNLVRLRYDEIPYFLQVTSISTQFSAGGTVGASATLPEAAANTFGLSGSLSYSESPVVTWSIPDSKAFYGRLNAPMGADQIGVLIACAACPKASKAGSKRLPAMTISWKPCG